MKIIAWTMMTPHSIYGINTFRTWNDYRAGQVHFTTQLEDLRGELFRGPRAGEYRAIVYNYRIIKDNRFTGKRTYTSWTKRTVRSDRQSHHSHAISKAPHERILIEYKWNTYRMSGVVAGYTG